jgi:hypothetical protein
VGVPVQQQDEGPVGVDDLENHVHDRVEELFRVDDAAQGGGKLQQRPEVVHHVPDVSVFGGLLQDRRRIEVTGDRGLDGGVDDAAFFVDPHRPVARESRPRDHAAQGHDHRPDANLVARADHRV